MIGIAMAGGRGSRMNLPQEKLLLSYKKPVVLHVLEALLRSRCFSRILAVTSPNSPQTRKMISEENYDSIDTSGDGYSKDLSFALRSLDGSVFVTSADLPLLDGDIVREIVRQHDPSSLWTSVLVTKEFLESLNLSSKLDVFYDGRWCCYTGISMVDSSRIGSLERIPEKFLVIDDRRIAFNLNTQQDYDLLDTA